MKQMAEIGLRLGDIKGATGSSYVELNGTKVFAAVYGPIEPDSQQQESAMSGIIECLIEDAWNPDVSLEGLQHKLQHTFTAAICHEAYFKTLIRIAITIINRGSSLADATSIAGSLALVDAGIEMNDFVVSCTVGRVDGTFVPFEKGDCQVRVAILPANEELVETEVIGIVDPAEMDEAINAAIIGCKDLTQSARAFLSSQMK